jgi:tetratricopeptide (TPR) repeat protein
MDTGAFQKNLETYIRNQSALPVLEVASEDSTNAEAAMTARTLSEAESEYFLGNLLAHTGRLSEAETGLQKAATLDPQLAPAQGALGALRMRQGRYKDAIEFFKRGEELNPRDYLVHYYVGAAMYNEANLTKVRPTDDQLDVMHEELTRAVEFAPFFVEASEILGRVALIQSDEPAEAIEVFRRALDLAPGRDSLALALATALAQSREGESPRPLLERLVENTSTDAAIKKEARNLIDFLDRPVEQLETLDFADLQSNDKPIVPQGAPLPEPPTRDGLGRNEVLEALTPVRAAVQGEKVSGLLTLIECEGGMTLSINAAGRVVKLHSDMPSQIEFVSYTSAVSNSISCGPTPAPGIPVAVTYRPQSSGDVAGAPLVVEFTAK